MVHILDDRPLSFLHRPTLFEVVRRIPDIPLNFACVGANFPTANGRLCYIGHYSSPEFGNSLKLYQLLKWVGVSQFFDISLLVDWEQTLGHFRFETGGVNGIMLLRGYFSFGNKEGYRVNLWLLQNERIRFRRRMVIECLGIYYFIKFTMSWLSF